MKSTITQISETFEFVLQLSFSFINGTLMILNFVLASNALVKPYSVRPLVVSLGLIIASLIIAWGSNKIFYKNRETQNTPFYSNAHHPLYLFLAAHSMLLLFITVPLLKKYPLLSPEINKLFFNMHNYISTYYYFFAQTLFIFALLAFSLYQLYRFPELSQKQKYNALILAAAAFAILFLATTYSTPTVAQNISKTNIGLLFEIFFGSTVGVINVSIIFPIRRLIFDYFN